MAEKHPKRPRDLNQWAKHMVDIATGEAEGEKSERQSKSAPAKRAIPSAKPGAAKTS